MRKIICLCLCMIMIVSTAVSSAETLNELVTQHLSAATDEDIAEAIATLKNEQRARLKTRVVLDPAECTVVKNKTLKISASVTDLPEGAEAGEYIWTSADESVAQCQKGTVKGIGAGTVNITCSTVLSDGTEVSAECTVTVVVPVQSISPKEKKTKVMASDSWVPEIIFKPEDATDKGIAMQSSDDSVVKINEDGSLTAVSAGKATVTVMTTDGSKKKASFTVEVTKKIGKFDGPITAWGLEWGWDHQTCRNKLETDGLAEWAESFSQTREMVYHWPDNVLKLTDVSKWNSAPLAFSKTGSGHIYFSPKKTFAGYEMKEVTLSFLNSLDGNGNVDPEKTELIGVRFYMSSSDYQQKMATIFKDILSKLEAQYGEFTVYTSKDLKRTTWSGGIKLYDDLTELYKTAQYYSTRDPYPGGATADRPLPGMLAVTYGADNTGIALWISGGISVFYGKTDAWERIQKIEQAIKKANPTEDAGV